MKATFRSGELVKMMRDLVRVVPSKSDNPALLHVLIQADKEQARVDMIASRETMSVRRTLFEDATDSPVTIEQSGTCFLPAKELFEIVKKAEGATVTLSEGKQKRTQIVFGKTKFELANLDPVLFTPYSEAEENTTSVVLMAPALHRLIRRTSYAVAKTEVRPTLTGVNLRLTDSTLRGDATDALRLATYTVTCKSVAGDDRSLVVPGVLLDKLALSLPSSDDDEEVTLTMGENSITVAWDDDSIRVVMRALEGTYPDTDRIIPRSMPHKVTVERQALLEACDRVSVLSVEDHQQSTVIVLADKITISADSAQYGKAADEVAVTTSQLKVESIRYWFNINYWLSALRSMDDVEQVDLQMLGMNQPIVMTPIGGPGLILLSPMRQAESGGTTQAG